MTWDADKVREMLIGARTLEIVVERGYENEGGFHEARQEATREWQEWADSDELTLTRSAYESWHAEGQKLHSALLDIWRAVTPDSEYGVFQSPEEVRVAVLQALTMQDRGRMQPVFLTQGEFKAVLDDIRFRVVNDDSFEGSLEYTLPEGAVEQHGFEVRASYRIGNTDGQGGMRVIGRLT